MKNSNQNNPPDYNDSEIDDDIHDGEDYEDIIVPKKKRRVPIWAKIIIITILIIFIIIIGVFLFINHELNKINREPANLDTIAPEDEYFETDAPPTNESGELVIDEVDPSEIVWDADTNSYSDDNVINILLIGQDRRPGETRARSDSMIILTINRNDNTLKMTSLLRDMYVQIPGYSDNRINASYAWGGMVLLDETIKKNFGIVIDRNIEVDFTAFTTIIDKIGGVDISLTEKEASYLRNKGYSVSSGVTHMDGDLALAYSRIRYIDSDFYRTNRQRTVLQTIFDKMKNQSLGDWYDLVDEIFPLLTTDMTNTEIINYLYIIYGLKASSIESYRVPADGTYSSQYIRKMAVLVPDLSANREYLLKNIYNK